jgi:hypothetical protein
VVFDGVAAGAAVVEELPEEFTGAPVDPEIASELSDEVNCGGVMASTAPSPPTVPPAISNARFIFLLSPSNL